MRGNNDSPVDKKARVEDDKQHEDPTEQDPQMRQQKQSLPQQKLQVAQLQERPFEAGVCVGRFMMFLHRIKQRPADNCITFWRKFVSEYFSPRAKQRLCFAQYKGAADMLSLGVLPADMWECDLCGNKSGKAVVASFDVLPRLFETKYASGITNELLSLNEAREYKALTGAMIQELFRKQYMRRFALFVTAIFASHSLQILRYLVGSFVLGVTECFLFPYIFLRRVLRGGKSLNHLGYPKKYVRVLQTYEVVKSMKDLMDFTYDHRIGPIEGWKRLSDQMALNPGNNNNGSAAAQSIFMILNSMKKPYSSQSQSPYLSQQRHYLATGGFPQQIHHHHRLLQPPHSHQQELQKQKQASSGQNGDNSNAERNPTSNISGGGGRAPSRNNSSKAASNNNPHLSEDATEVPDDFSQDNFSNDSDV